VRSSYEDLRAKALTGGRGPGLAIFLHHGMREWIEVCSSCMTAAPLEAAHGEAAQFLNPCRDASEIVSIWPTSLLKNDGRQINDSRCHQK